MSQHDDHDPHVTQHTPGAAFDPVCRHWVDPRKAHGPTRYGADSIYFCSTHCQRAFDKDPARFARTRDTQPHEGTMQQTTPLQTGFLQKMRMIATPSGSATDPVCHMKVDLARTPHKLDHEGTTHAFCSAGCKQTFEADPRRYLSAGAPR